MSAMGSTAPAASAAAAELAVDVGDLATQRPLFQVWNATSRGGGEKLLLVCLDARASSSERQRFASALDRLAGVGIAAPPGLLVPRAVARDRAAFLVERSMEGTLADAHALRWPLRKRVEFGRKLLAALEALHAAGIVHGSLCAANVLIDHALDPIVSEAGMVSVGESFGGDTDGHFGYGAYAAPEVALGKATVASDVYSAGRLLHELVIGRGPEGTQLAPLTHVPKGLADVIARCTLAEALQRFGSAAEVLAALDAVAAQIEQAAEGAPRTAAPPRMPSVAARGATVKPSEPVLSIEPVRVPLAVVGALLLVATPAAAWFLGASTEALRAIFAGALAAGGGLVTLFAPHVGGRPGLTRAVLALGAFGALLVTDPLHALERAAAEQRLRGDDASRAKALAELLQLGRDLQRANLARLDLRRADLRGADLRGADLAGTNLSEASLFAAVLDGARVTGAKLGAADLTQSTFANADGARAAECDGRTTFPIGWRCAHGHPTDAPPEATPEAAPATASAPTPTLTPATAPAPAPPSTGTP